MAVKLNLKTLQCAYLYSDGHAVLKHQKTDKDTGTKIEYVELVEKFGPRRYPAATNPGDICDMCGKPNTVKSPCAC